MLGEVTHLQTILEDLTNLTAEPTKLPPASEQVYSPSSSSSSSVSTSPSSYSNFFPLPPSVESLGKSVKNN